MEMFSRCTLESYRSQTFICLSQALLRYSTSSCHPLRDRGAVEMKQGFLNKPSKDELDGFHQDVVKALW